MTSPKRQPPTIERLRELLVYYPLTGKLYWRVRVSPRCKAGDEAFTHTNAKGYRQGKVDQIPLLAHRVAWALHHGAWPIGDIDHIHGVNDDNRISQLRDVPHVVNGRNRRLSANNTSGVNGVGRRKRGGRWYAHIPDGKRRKHLGYFDTIEEATAARLAAMAGRGYTDRHGKGQRRRLRFGACHDSTFHRFATLTSHSPGCWAAE